MHSSTLNLWAVPSLPDPSQKKPVQPARNPATSVPHGLVPQHFVVAKQKQTALEFGAFRPDEFALRADQTRTIAMQLAPETLRTLPLGTALDKWWKEVKKPTVKKDRTVEAYELYLSNIKGSAIGTISVSQLHLGHMMEYQRIRKAGYTKIETDDTTTQIDGVCVSYVNHETNMIAQMLAYCDMWEFIGKRFKPLPPPDWRPPKVLTQEEEDKFFFIAASRIDWQVAYWAVSLTNNTSAAGMELRNLQFKHVFIDREWKDNPKLHVPDGKAKNQFRARVIPLNEVALKQVKRIMGRAVSLGAGLPDHYLFPKMVTRNNYDVTQPASRSFIRKAFKELREATGLPWLQPRNFRNQVITKLFENGTPDETITAIAGHNSINMSRYYSQIRMHAKKDALSALVPKKKAVQNAG